jgi:hypothetical protein
MAKTIQYRVEVNTSRAEDNLQDVNNQLDDIQEKSKVDLLIESADAVKSVGDVRKAYRALRDAQIEVGEGTEEFTRLGEAAAGLQDKLNSVNEVSKDLGGSTLERLRNSLGRIREGIVNLDIDKVRQGFVQLRTVFVGLTRGLSTARLAAIGFGTALAATGIGAIVIALTTLVSQFDDLASAGGLVGRIFTGINNIVEGFKNTVLDLADAWGLVDKNQTKAAKSAAEATAAAQKEVREDVIREIAAALYDPSKLTDVREKFINKLKEDDLIAFTQYQDEQQEKLAASLIDEERFSKRLNNKLDEIRREREKKIKEFDAEVLKKQKEDLEARQKAIDDAFKQRLEQIRLEGEINKEDLDDREKSQKEFFDKEYKLFEDAENKKKALRDKLKEDIKLTNDEFFNAAVERIEKEKELEAQLTEFILQQELAKQQFVQETFFQSVNFNNALAGLVNQLYANEIAAAEGNFERQEELREESFEANKALQIANTVITTAQAVVNGLNAGLQIGGPWGIALGAATAAAAAATGAVQIATISATQYTPTGAGSGSSFTPSTFSAPAQQLTPNITFAGEGTTLNQVGQGSNNQFQMSASISVSEINDVMNQVQIYETGSIIGGG